MMETKVCSKCGQEKPLTEFCRDRSSRDSYCYWCVKCKKIDAKRYYQNNKKKIITRTSKYHKENKDKANKTAKRWRIKNPEKSKAVLRKGATKYKKNNPEKAKAHDYANYRKKELMEDKCEVCGTAKNLLMHHPDYSKPAWVLTLCPEHHQEIHILDKLH